VKPERNIQAAALGALALWSVLALAAGTATPPVQEAWRAKKQELEARYGVQIVFDHPEFYTRPSVADQTRWKAPPVEQRLAILQKLEWDLSKYDPRWVRRSVERICLFDDLEYRSLGYSGTYDSNRRWLLLDVHWLGDTGRHADAVGLHHEFSSLLLKSLPDRFPTRAWKEVAPPSFRYTFEESSYRNLTTEKQRNIGDFDTYERGFICEYGELTFEDDVNTYAQYLMAKPYMLLEIAALHRRVLAKAMLLERFYDELGVRNPALPVPRFAALGSAPLPPWEIKRRDLAYRYGLDISFYPYFPCVWLRHDPRFQPIPPQSRLAVLEALAQDLGKYEPRFLAQNLSRVSLCESLAFAGRQVAGMFDRPHGTVYVRGDALGEAAPQPTAIGFHGILAGLLLEAHKPLFPAEEWRATIPAATAYLSGGPLGSEAVAVPPSRPTDPQALGRGFLCDAAQGQFEADVGSYAQFLLSRPTRLKQLGMKYPKVGRKVELLSGFYGAIGFRQPPGTEPRVVLGAPPGRGASPVRAGSPPKKKAAPGTRTFFGTLRPTADGFRFRATGSGEVYDLAFEGAAPPRLDPEATGEVSAIVVGRVQDGDTGRPILKVKSLYLRKDR